MTAPYAFQIDDAANYVGVSRFTIYTAVKTGELPARKIGARWSIRREDLERWHASHPDAEHAA